MSPAESV